MTPVAPSARSAAARASGCPGRSPSRSRRRPRRWRAHEQERDDEAAASAAAATATSGGGGGGGVKAKRRVAPGCRAPIDRGTGPCGEPRESAGYRTGLRKHAAGILAADVCRTTFERSCATPSTCCPRARSSSAASRARARPARPCASSSGSIRRPSRVTLGWSVVLSQAARVPGRRAPAGADRRRLHRARRRPQRASSKTRPMLTPEQIDAQRAATTSRSSRASSTSSASSCAATRSGSSRSARRACSSSPRARRSRASSSATTSPSAAARASADLAAGAALPAAPGVRLRGRRGRRRARRHRPEVQPAGGARAAAAVGPASRRS